MRELSFHQLTDLALYAHYCLFKQGYYDHENHDDDTDLKLFDAGKFTAAKCIEALIDSKHLRRGKNRKLPPVITGPGIRRVERLLSDKGNFLILMKSRFFMRGSPTLTLTLVGMDTETSGDLVLRVMGLQYGFEE